MQSPAGRRRGQILDVAIGDPQRCRECDGACCKGFVSVALSSEEYERLRALGAQRLEDWAGRCWLIIEHGCEFLVAGRCSIYPYRPELCRRFICEGD